MAVMVEQRSYRPFKSSEEYLYAMKEDLAEWLNNLYPELFINVNNFMDRLDTGVALCEVRKLYKYYFNEKSIFKSFLFVNELLFFFLNRDSVPIRPNRSE